MKVKRANNSGKIIKIIAIALVVIITLLILMFNSGVAALRKASGYVIDPILSVSNTAFDWMGNFFAGFSSRMGLKQELEQANEKLAQLENVQSIADAVKNDNEQLLALLNESASYPEFEYIHAEVLAHSVDDYSATFTLDKGSDDGLEANMVVIAVGGLAGKIIEVSDSTSILLAITDSRCGVPALAESSRDTGVVKGVAESGGTAGYCRMTELPTNALLKPGDTVITSGMGGIYPKGIIIGTITEVSRASTGSINSSAKLTPTVDFDHLEHVLILKTVGE